MKELRKHKSICWITDEAHLHGLSHNSGEKHNVVGVIVTTKLVIGQFSTQMLKP